MKTQDNRSRLTVEQGHDELLAQEEWTRNVREMPRAYNFVSRGECNYESREHGGLLNAYGRCEACQNEFASQMQSAEDRAYGCWAWNRRLPAE